MQGQEMQGKKKGILNSRWGGLSKAREGSKVRVNQVVAEPSKARERSAWQ